MTDERNDIRLLKAETLTTQRVFGVRVCCLGSRGLVSKQHIPQPKAVITVTMKSSRLKPCLNFLAIFVLTDLQLEWVESSWGGLEELLAMLL